MRTCVVEVSGKANCSPDTLGEEVSDSFRLGMAMMTVSGLTGSEDKRWDRVVYGVTDKLCGNGGVSLAAMRTHPGVSKDVKAELAGLIAAKKLPMEATAIAGVDFFIGYLTGRDCIAAFGYPNDQTVLVVFAGKDDREKAGKALKAMLGAAKSE